MNIGWKNHRREIRITVMKNAVATKERSSSLVDSFSSNLDFSDLFSSPINMKEFRRIKSTASISSLELSNEFKKKSGRKTCVDFHYFVRFLKKCFSFPGNLFSLSFCVSNRLFCASLLFVQLFFLSLNSMLSVLSILLEGIHTSKIVVITMIGNLLFFTMSTIFLFITLGLWDILFLMETLTQSNFESTKSQKRREPRLFSLNTKTVEPSTFCRKMQSFDDVEALDRYFYPNPFSPTESRSNTIDFEPTHQPRTQELQNESEELGEVDFLDTLRDVKDVQRDIQKERKSDDEEQNENSSNSESEEKTTSNEESESSSSLSEDDVKTGTGEEFIAEESEQLEEEEGGEKQVVCEEEIIIEERKKRTVFSLPKSRRDRIMGVHSPLSHSFSHPSPHTILRNKMKLRRMRSFNDIGTIRCEGFVNSGFTRCEKVEVLRQRPALERSKLEGGRYHIFRALRNAREKKRREEELVKFRRKARDESKRQSERSAKLKDKDKNMDRRNSRRKEGCLEKIFRCCCCGRPGGIRNRKNLKTVLISGWLLSHIWVVLSFVSLFWIEPSTHSLLFVSLVLTIVFHTACVAYHFLLIVGDYVKFGCGCVVNTGVQFMRFGKITEYV